MEKAIPEKLVGHKDELQRHYAGGHDDCIEEFLTNLNS